MRTIREFFSDNRLSLGYKFSDDKDVISLIYINYFLIFLFSLVVVLLHTGNEELIPVSYRYHTLILIAVIDLLLIRMGAIRIAKLLILISLPFIILILPSLARLYDNEFYFWFPYIPIALSIIPHFIFKPIKERIYLICFLTIYFLVSLFIDDFMILVNEGEVEIIPIVIQNRFYYNLIPLFILGFVNLALGLLLYQNARYEEIMKKQQNELIQAEKMASLGVLTAGIAHEINNPLNFISGGLTALDDLIKEYLKLDDSKSEEKQTIVKQIDEIMDSSYEGVFRAAKIVKNLKSFTSGSVEKSEVVKIMDVIESALVILRSKIPANIEIERSYETIPEVSCFRQKIQQVFINIIDNALYSISGEEKIDKGMIMISTAAREIDQKAFVSVQIENSGPPIPDAHIRKIFDPFFTTKDPGKGVGLGMSISYNIIREHRGSLFVSNQNNMVVFEVLLPVSGG